MHLLLRLPASEVRCTVALDLEHAPQTSAAIASVLPRHGTLLHSRRSGQEVIAVLPSVAIEDGSLISELQPGDVVVASFPAHYRDAPPASVHDPAEPYTHLGIIYGPDARFSTPEGYVPVHHLGRVVEGMQDLVRACTAIRSTGAQPFELTLAHQGGAAREDHQNY